MSFGLSLHSSTSSSETSSSSDLDWWQDSPFTVFTNHLYRYLILQAERDRLHRLNTRTTKKKSTPPRHAAKRRRLLPVQTEDAASSDGSSTCSTASTPPKIVVVIGVPTECSVMELKSRFKIFGLIIRARMKRSGVAYIKFRSNAAAQSAVDAARDLHSPITLRSLPVKVRWAGESDSQWKEEIQQEDGPSSE